MKFLIKKLGCPKNDVDGDYIAGRLQQAGHQITERETEAEGVVVNTCGFILPAKEESIGEILRFEKLRKDRKIKRLYITGCLSQRYGEKLLKDIKGLDGVFGLGQLDELVAASANGEKQLLEVKKIPSEKLRYIAGTARYIEGNLPYEYLKISDGCDRYCSYCVIPHIRGRYRSRPVEDIVEEAEFLADCGKKEIILVSQEGTGYGRDFNDGTDILTLLERLEKIEGIHWIRLLYLHPESLTDEIIEYISSSSKTLDYFDVPLQHISDRILSKMNRQITRVRIESILEKIRKSSKNSVIRTTFIAGLPGETEQDFAELCDFIAGFEFDRLGVFKYSREEGTAGYKFEGQVPEEVKEKRLDELMMLQQEIAFRKNIALIDTIQKVIIDKSRSKAIASGRTRGDCPDIDQTVYIKKGDVRIGDILDAKIIMAEGYDLIASTEI